MPTPIDDQVIDFYENLFRQIFADPFRSKIPERRKRNDVNRRIEETADAASQSLIRFFINEQLTEAQVADILNGFAELPRLLRLEEISNSNVTPESVAEELLSKLPCPNTVKDARMDAVYRVALHTMVQGLMLVGPVVAEWQSIKFASTFELLNRVIDQLNVITEQLNAQGGPGQAAADERYENSYRDYLLQRFYRVEAGTVRMTTNMDVDLRELFVMPRVLPRPKREKDDGTGAIDPTTPMNLAAARKFIGGEVGHDRFATQEDAAKRKKSDEIPALNQVKCARRNVIIGLPGSGKSTFFEWLQLKLAADKEALSKEGGGMIPLLLRVRQLKNPKKPPAGSALIEEATASKDRAALMPEGWIERQMKAGRVLLMLDGLDETEPEICDRYILPWLIEMSEQYPDCGYLVSSRPVGYPPGALTRFNFAECDLLDFGEKEVAEYVKHWCTAVRLAQNEPKQEARREGAADGERIFADFQRHPYIRNLAHNPLMLSAICLVNRFERGKLPEDRAMLYKLCVEGLLHHWDQRRGIHSDFTLEEKLRTCREVALAMQADDRAEYEINRVQRIFSVVLGDPTRAEKLLEHIRYRTGLLIERRAGMFAFAHLTFQEYLAAQAVYEGNKLNIDASRLVHEHSDGRWGEVIALYCGSVSAKAASEMIKQLIEQPDTKELSLILTEVYLSSGPKLAQDSELRRKVLERIAVAPYTGLRSQLNRFPSNEVAPIANSSVGKLVSDNFLSESYSWLIDGHPDLIDEAAILPRLQKWRELSPTQITELIHILHAFGSSRVLSEMATDPDMYEAPGPEFKDGGSYNKQAEIALLGLARRKRSIPSGFIAAALQVIRTLSSSNNRVSVFAIPSFINNLMKELPTLSALDQNTKSEISSLTRQWAATLAKINRKHQSYSRGIDSLNSLASFLENSTAATIRLQNETESKTTFKRTSKKTSKRR